MSRHTRKPISRRLTVQTLEARVVPVTNFQILTLGSSGGAVVEHSATTGGDMGGVAISGASAFVTGQSFTGRFNLSDLGGAASVGTRYEALTGNLRTQTVYVLGRTDIVNGVVPLDASTASGGALVDHLLELDASTGALTGNQILLSTAIFVRSGTGIFAGYDRIVLSVPNGVGSDTVNQIDLSAGNVGTVSTLGSIGSPVHQSSSTWAYWGTAEHFGPAGGQDYIDYVLDFQHVDRTDVQTATASTLATFSNLSNMASFSVSPANDRWYFHNQGNSQFHSGSPVDQILGYEPATFQVGNFIVKNLNDSGTDSLRAVVALANAAGPGQTVGFLAGLNGTITLTSGAIPVTQTVDIEGPGSNTIAVAATGANNLFTASGGSSLTLHGLTLSNTSGLTVGYALTAAGDVIVTAGAGDVTFTNTLNVQVGTMSVTDGNAVVLGPTTTVDGFLIATNTAGGFNLPAGDLMNGFGGVTGNLADHGTLAGSLSVSGNVIVPNGGTIAPGSGAGSIATINVNGNLTFQPGGTFTADINGPGFADQIAVNGAVDLGATGDMLNPVFGYAPNSGDAYELIANNGTNPIIGLLNGVRNRSGEQLPNLRFFQVRYDGGTGNDLVLVDNTAPALDTSVQVKLDPITENVPPNSNTGTTIDSLVATNGLYSDAEGLFRSGLAFTGLDSTNGAWQFSRNAGTSWTSFGTLSAISATLLEADGAGQNRIRFNPNHNFFGTSTVSFKAWDTTDGKADGTIGADASAGGGNNPYSTASVTATVQVLAVNQPPVAVNDAYTTVENTTLTVNAANGVLANDTDPDGPFPLTAALVSGPGHGTLTLNSDGSFTYVPTTFFSGADQFTYKAIDGDGAYGVGVVTLTITHVNQPPTVVNDTVSLPENSGAVPIDVLGNDSGAPDTGETLTITAVTQPTHGTVTIINGGTKVSYTPNQFYHGPDAFTYTVTDNGTTNGSPDPKSATGSVAVTVTFVNQPPVANNDTATVNEDSGAQAINVLANDSDPDNPGAGQTLTVINVTQGANGTVAIGPNGANVLYTPNSEFSGSDQFIYTISDGFGGTATAAVSVTVANTLDDRLEVLTSAGTTTFTEKVPPPSTAVVIDPLIQVGTALEGVMTGATIKFSAGFVPKKDLLVFVPVPGSPIKGKYSAATGILKLTGTDLPANYQLALRNVEYLNLSPASVDGIRTVSFQLQDSAGVGAPGYKLVKVVGVNTPPVLSPATGPTAKFTIGKKAVAVSGPIQIKDLDNLRMQGATVAITGGFQPTIDVLTAVTTKTGLTANYNASTGVLTITGNGSIATYLKVLKSIKFSTTGGAGVNRTLSFQVDDGESLNHLSNIVTRTVTVS